MDFDYVVPGETKAVNTHSEPTPEQDTDVQDAPCIWDQAGYMFLN
jgi:hypothetical protein